MTDAAPKPRSNATLAFSLAAMVFAMIGMAFAAVPLYEIFCQITGYGGTTQRATAEADRTLERSVIVRFDSNTSGLPWSFRPAQSQVEVKLGETTIVNYIAENIGARATTGTATFNVQPPIAGYYFHKIECFCFNEQKLEPGESMEMPVQFFVSPDLADDHELDGTRTITLSYTFFPMAGEGQPVAQTDGDAAGESM